MKNLNKYIGKALEENRVDEVVTAFVSHLPWDDVMLAFANVCVYQANKFKQDSKDYRTWMKRGRVYYDTITDKRKATVQKRQLAIGNVTTTDGDDASAS